MRQEQSSLILQSYHFKAKQKLMEVYLILPKEIPLLRPIVHDLCRIPPNAHILIILKQARVLEKKAALGSMSTPIEFDLNRPSLH